MILGVTFLPYRYSSFLKLLNTLPDSTVMAFEFKSLWKSKTVNDKGKLSTVMAF